MIKQLLILSSLLFILSGCSKTIEFMPNFIGENVNKNSYKVENVNVQIKENSPELMDTKWNEYSMAINVNLYPKPMNYTAAKEAFSKYFKNVSDKDGDIKVETELKYFFQGGQKPLTLYSTAKMKIYVKAYYKDKLLIDKDYYKDETGNIIGSHNNLLTIDSKGFIDRQTNLVLLDIYQEQVIPDLLKALKEM